ncbi:MAG: peptidylglycine alpha-amidating monooxygenase, partial [Dehalococcoidia bacterium]|nr:peptidylglycine alpha-amidating monooxygenase [Dehalococcoidia bacterium]
MPLVSSDTIFEPVPHWAKIPHGVWLKEATSVAVDKDDNVFVFNRGNKPMLVFDPD